MKLNKSILGLVILAIFIFSSCSQARYGSHTRRVKANNIVQKATKAEMIRNATANITKEEDAQEQKENTSNEIVKEIKSTIDTKSIVAPTESTSYSQQKKDPARMERRVAKKVEKLIAKSNVATKVVQAKRDVTHSVTKTDDEVGDILYIILVVILVLLIINLITSLIPALSWLLGIALLVLLIYLLLQML